MSMGYYLFSGGGEGEGKLNFAVFFTFPLC